MPLIYTKVIPDLLYYTEQYVKNSIANKFKIPFPPTFSSAYLYDNKSFIRLLFDESWPSSITDYTHLYKEETDLSSVPEILRRRMMVYPGISSYYTSTSLSTGVNIFNLQSDDLTLLDLLLEYRTDSTADISLIVYSNLTTNLSKLIYIYLQFKLNDDYTLFDNITIISSENNILEKFFESFIIDKIFETLSGYGT